MNCWLLPGSACIVVAIFCQPFYTFAVLHHGTWETPSMSWKGWKLFYELHLTILLILVYWRKWCYSIFNSFYVILLQIFMWYYSSWEMVEPMSINSHENEVIRESLTGGGSSYWGVFWLNHCNTWTKVLFCLFLYFSFVVLLTLPEARSKHSCQTLCWHDSALLDSSSPFSP